MKKMILLAFLVLGIGAVQAQQAVVKTPEAADASILNQDQAPAVPFHLQFMPINERTSVHPDGRVGTIAKSAEHQGLTEIGFMANTYAVIGDSRNQIAADPQTNTVAIVYRGNDRSTSGDGNTLFVRYSADNGANWGPEGDNIANSGSPRYPNIFLPNQGGTTYTSVIWPQVDQYGDGTTGFRDIYTMKSGVGNTNIQYSKVPDPPYWSIPYNIVPDQSTGAIYSMALGLEPSNGASTGEIYLLRSADAGATWAPVTFDTPVFTSDIVPAGYFASNIRLDISPNGVMALGFALIIESEPGRAFLLDENHEVAWRISNDKGLTWGPLQRFRPADVQNKPSPFDAKFIMAWDFDIVLDYLDRPHFLTVCSADINPFSPFNDAPTDSTISLFSTDSTFATEFTYYGDPNDINNWNIFPIGPVRSVRTDRRSFTAASSDNSAFLIRNEPKWARSYDGKKIFAKWISPITSWRVAPVAGQNTLFQDTLLQVYANGRHVDSRSGSAWTFGWPFGSPDLVTNEQDSVMRFTALEDIGAKFTKSAYYVSNNDRMHVMFVEWGIGETRDDDPVNTDQTLWYVQDMLIPVSDVASVEQIDNTPADFTLSQNYPNPFNPSTEITFSLPQAGQTTLRVFNLLGQEVATLVNEFRNAGTHRTTFDANNLPSGMYVYRLESGSFSTARRMMLSK
ncbi:MAG: T9SS type A sorting domain-containing protein [Bacteroidetes bacterium]|nr:T9SS type A sorting domain-containing protein [Bacteroidota bacterium]